MGFIIEDKKLVKYESEPGIIFVVIPEGITRKALRKSEKMLLETVLKSRS